MSGAPPGPSPSSSKCPRSTVAAILARAGLNRLARLTPPAPSRRYEWAHPGDLVHLDVKPLARIAGVGHRIHGDRRARVRGIGWEYAHVAIDDHSRAPTSRSCPIKPARRRRASSAAPSRWFARRGVRIARVLTDNGGNYRSQAFQARARTPPAPAETDPALSAPDQRQSRTIHPNAAARVGLRAALRDLARDGRRRCSRGSAPTTPQRPHASLGYQPPCSRFPRVAQ